MLKREITYENPFTKKKVTETHYFHISKADLVEMEIEEHGQTYVKDGEELTGMQAKLQRIVDSEDGKAIMTEFKDIIRRAYGIREEGDKFRKTQKIWEDFASTEAFSQLLFELCTQAEEGGKFIQGVVPHNLDQIAEEVRQEAEKATQQAAFVEAASTKTGDAPTEGSTVDQNLREVPRAEQLAQATPEHPVTLTEAEVSAMDSDDLKSGVATGRFRIS